MLGPGNTLWNINETSLQSLYEIIDGDVSFINYGTTMQNRNVRVTEMMAVVDFQAGTIPAPDVATAPAGTLVLEHGLINLLDLEANN
jgi:hypothetical protein